MLSNKYEKYSAQSYYSASYDFNKGSKGEVYSSDDNFWNDINVKGEQEVNNHNATVTFPRINLLHVFQSCLWQVVNFYRPSPSYSMREGIDEEGLQDDFSFTATSNAEREIKNIYVQIRLRASILSVISLLFGCWAVINTHSMEEGQDVGMYSYSTTLASSHYLLCLTRRHPTSRNMVATTCTRFFVTSSHTLVFLNYCLGIVFAYTVGSHPYHMFGLQCILFSCFWGFVSYQGFMLLSKLQKLELEVAPSGDEEHNFDGDRFF